MSISESAMADISEAVESMSPDERDAYDAGRAVALVQVVGSISKAIEDCGMDKEKFSRRILSLYFKWNIEALDLSEAHA